MQFVRQRQVDSMPELRSIQRSELSQVMRVDILSHYLIAHDSDISSWAPSPHRYFHTVTITDIVNLRHPSTSRYPFLAYIA